MRSMVNILLRHLFFEAPHSRGLYTYARLELAFLIIMVAFCVFCMESLQQLHSHDGCGVDECVSFSLPL